MKIPEMIPVQSSNVKALGHSTDGLFVEFHGSGVYHYPDVPDTVFQNGLLADSPGKWFRSAIYGQYEGGKFNAESE